MTRIEQINWARQILSQAPTVPERDDETVKYLTEANLEPGSGRARVTTANARWAMAAEARDRIKDRLSAEWEAGIE